LDDASADASSLAARAAEYEALIELADRNFEDELYREARRQYVEAASILPAETHPQDQISECDRLQAAADADTAEEAAEAADADAAAARDAQYNELVAEGDAAFAVEDWSSAKVAYASALEVKPGERYPRGRLERIANTLASKDDALADAAAENRRLEQEAERLRADEEAGRDADARAAEEAAERDRRLALQQAEADQETAERRKQEEAARNRAQQVAAAMQSDDTDAAELYYREALRSEERARIASVERVKTADTALRGSRSADARQRIEQNQHGANEQASHAGVIASQGALDHSARHAENERHAAAHRAHETRLAQRGEALRQDGALTADDAHRLQDRITSSHSVDYRAAMPDLAADQRRYNEVDRGLERSAADRRVINQQQADQVASNYRTIGEGHDIRVADHLNRLADQEHSQDAHLSGRATEAAHQGYELRRERFALDPGSEPSLLDYRMSPEDEEIMPGIHEESYDITNGLVIERTVRRGNEIRHFRKVVTKTGVYYFEEDGSITEETWKRETTVILD
jgi:hypothetical protein